MKIIEITLSDDDKIKQRENYMTKVKKTKVVGLQKGEVKLLPYTSEWKKLYKQEEELLCSSIGKHIEDIQHIGSTAIPGVFSKPIIDIAIAVKSFKFTKEIIRLLRKLGYE